MDFLELSRERFSARKYTGEAVSDADLRYILECARLAPSATNAQPWKVLVVRSEEAKARLRQCYDREWFATAPLYLVTLKNTAKNWVRRFDGKPHGDVDLGIMTEHLCLAATARGLATCWVCAFDPDRFRTLFPQPEGWEAVAIVPLGHAAPDCPRKEKARMALEELAEEI